MSAEARNRTSEADLPQGAAKLAALHAKHGRPMFSLSVPRYAVDPSGAGIAKSTIAASGHQLFTVFKCLQPTSSTRAHVLREKWHPSWFVGHKALDREV